MRRSPLLPIFLIVLVDVLGLTIMMPTLPFYAERFGASALQVTLLLTSYAGCQLVSGPLLGRISDRTGRKPLLIISQAGTFIGFLVMAGAQSLWMLFLARIIDGCTAGNLSLAQAYIADVTEPKNRSRSFAVIGIAFGIGFLIGPGVAAMLGHADLRRPIYLAAALSFTSIMATTFLLPRVQRQATPAVEAGPAGPGGERLSIIAWSAYTQYFERPVLRSLLLQFFAFTFAFSLFTSGIALFAERRLVWGEHMFGIREVGYIFVYSGLLGVLLQGGLIGRLVKRLGEVPLVTTGFLSAAIGYAVLSQTVHVPLLLVAATFASYGTGVLRPVITSLITQQVGRQEQGVVLGLNQSLQSVSQIVAPLIAGAMIQEHLLSSWAALAAGVMAIGLLLNRAGPMPQAAGAVKVEAQ